MRLPAWYLLIWAAVVASLVATLLGLAARSRLGRPAPGRAAALGFLLGVLFWGPIYGLVFENAGVASALTGACIGALHGVLAAIVAVLRQRRQRTSDVDVTAAMHGRRLLTRVVYGTIIGFLYVVPRP